MKRDSLIISAIALNVLPTKAIDADNSRLYGSPDSLLENTEAHSEESLMRLPYNHEVLSDETSRRLDFVENLFKKALNNQEYAEYYLNNKYSILEKYGIDYSNVNDDEAIRLVEVIISKDFVDASFNRDYKKLLEILNSHGFIGSNSIDFSKDIYSKVIKEDREFYKKQLAEIKSGIHTERSTQVFSLSNGNPTSNRDELCVTCISIAAVAVNVAAATNIVAVVVALISVGVSILGPENPELNADCFIDPNSLNCEISKNNKSNNFGIVALNDESIKRNQNLAVTTAIMSGVESLYLDIQLDLAYSELRAFYEAAFEAGLISTFEDKEEIISLAKSELRKQIYSKDIGL